MTLTDQQLEQRLADVKTEMVAPDTGGLLPVAHDVAKDLLIECLDLEIEIRDRKRDKFATIAYQPPDCVTKTLGH